MDNLNSIIRASANSSKPFNGDTRLAGFVDPERLRHNIWLYERIEVESEVIRGFCTVNDVETHLITRRAATNYGGGTAFSRTASRFAFMRSDL